VVARPSGRRPVFPDLVRSEWIKLRTVRSTYWTLLAAAAGMAGSGVLLTSAYVRHLGSASPAARSFFDPAAYSMSGFFLAQLAIGVLGVVVMTSEYATGSIRATFAAAPQRWEVLAAKAAAFGAAAAVAGVASAFGAFFAGQAVLSQKGIQAHIGDPGVLRSVLGAGLYLAVLGLLSLGLGALIRRTAGAIGALVGVVIILPVFTQALPSSWQDAVTPYLPSVAGQAVIGRTKFAPPVHLLPPWAGFGVFCGYAAAALIASALALTRRDA
jgi:ABC-type transport system involved in multi-copper enzyme maturation permease subunit